MFRVGQYEDHLNGNSNFDEGDWNGDGDFDSSDLVTEFQANMYQSGAGVKALVAASTSHDEVSQIPIRRFS